MKDWIKRHSAAVAATVISMISVLTMTGMTVSLRPVTINDGGRIFSIATFCRDSYTVLAKAGVSLQEEDVVKAELDEEQPQITIDRSFEVPIMVNGKEAYSVRMLKGTVADALAEAGVAENTYDLVGAQPTDVLSPETVITIQPYECTVRTEIETVAHEESVTFTDDLPAGARKVERAGVDGKTERVIREYYKDGELIRSEIVSETVTEPVTELASIGNGALSVTPIPLELDENGRPLTYKKVLTGDACAYCADEGAKTSTGTYCDYGTVAVNPEVIPYGSKLFIVSDDGFVYGYGVAQDTGATVRQDIIVADLYVHSYKEARQFGRRNVSVYILE